MIKCQREAVLSSNVSVDFSRMQETSSGRFHLPGTSCLAAASHQLSSNFNKLNFNKSITPAVWLISTRPLQSNDTEIVLILSLPVKSAPFCLFPLSYRAVCFFVSMKLRDRIQTQLQHWAQQLFSGEILSRALWKSVDCFTISSAGRPFLQTPPPHPTPPPWPKVSGQVPLTSQQPHLPETRFLFTVLTCVAARWQATTSKSDYDPVNSSLWFPVFVCMTMFFFWFNQGLLANKEPNKELFFFFLNFTHSLPS